jgi:hypothetical protein
MSGSQRGVVVVSLSLPPASARTLFDRLGDYVPLAALAILGLAALFGLFRWDMARRVRRAT